MASATMAGAGEVTTAETEGAVRDERTLREARAQYFVENGFGDDGGYGSPWVDFKLGPLPLPFPNTGSRVRAVGYHDLHHIITGYRTDLVGELEIGAWELGGGCKDYAAAWILDLSGMASGMLLSPRRMFRAFVRGMRSRTVYGEDLETLLQRTVADVRDERVHAGGAATIRDVALFASAVFVGATLGAALMLALIAVGPFLFLWSLVAPRWVEKMIAAG